jgi:hypothetical protein
MPIRFANVSINDLYREDSGNYPFPNEIHFIVDFEDRLWVIEAE